MTTVLLDSPSNTTQEVQVSARAVAGLTQRPDELTPAAQVQYSTSKRLKLISTNILNERMASVNTLTLSITLYLYLF